MKTGVAIFFVMIQSCIGTAQNQNLPNQSYLIKNLVIDFGAVGDGIVNDQDAFKRASDFFNKRKGNGKLIIPFGVYKVGKQMVDTPKRFMSGIDVIELNNVENFEISGVQNAQQKMPLIKFCNSLYFGSFYSSGKQFAHPICNATKDYYDYQNRADVGSIISLNNCIHVSIRNLELDGNIENLIIGGCWGDIGWQLLHSGVHTDHGSSLKLENIYAHHFALDGVTNSGTRNFELDSVRCLFNGRQGFSWVDGDSLYANKCQFSYNGRTRISSPPGAGIDIEPEQNHNISFARFYNCTIGFNQGCGLLMVSAPLLVRDMSFYDCNFIGAFNWSLWIPGHDLRFDHCNIYGNLVHTTPKSSVQRVSDIPHFVNCYFSDVYDGVSTKMVSSYLFDLNSENINLDSCKVHVLSRGILWHSGDCVQTDSLTSSIKNSEMIDGCSNCYSMSAGNILFSNVNLFSTSSLINNSCKSNLDNFNFSLITQDELLDKLPDFENVVPITDVLQKFSCTDTLYPDRSNEKVSRRE